MTDTHAESIKLDADSRDSTGSSDSGSSNVVAVNRAGSVSVAHGNAAGLSGESAAIFSMIERAARDPHVDIDKMERLFAMQQQAVDRNAKTAYLSAFSRMQSEMPAAARKGEGHNKKKYARFEDIVEALRPILHKHGFSLSHRVNTEGNQIKVTGILGHADGHSESTVITLPPDTSGNKTPVHAMASAISYGKRYVSLTLTGIATDDDDDGKAAGAQADVGTITDEQAKQIKDGLKFKGLTEERFCRKYKIDAVESLPADLFKSANAAIASHVE